MEWCHSHRFLAYSKVYQRDQEHGTGHRDGPPHGIYHAHHVPDVRALLHRGRQHDPPFDT